MADDDGLRQVYGIPGVAAIRQGYMFARTRVRRRLEKKNEFSEELKKSAKEETEEDKGVDIKV